MRLVAVASTQLIYSYSHWGKTKASAKQLFSISCKYENRYTVTYPLARSTISLPFLYINLVVSHYPRLLVAMHIDHHAALATTLGQIETHAKCSNLFKSDKT